MNHSQKPRRRRRTAGDSISAILAFIVLGGCITAVLYTIAQALNQ